MKAITIRSAKAAHTRSYKPIGYVHELQANGIEDPIAVFGEEVQKLNQEYKKEKNRLKKNGRYQKNLRKDSLATSFKESQRFFGM